METLKNLTILSLSVAATFGAAKVEAAFPSAGQLPEVVHRYYSFPAGQKILIENGSGTSTLTHNDRLNVMITATKRRGGEDCRVRTEKVAELEINVRVESELKSNCDIDIAVSIPQGLNMDLRSGSGDVTLVGVKGALKFELGSASLRGRGEFSAVDGRSGSGHVDLDGLAGGGEIRSGSGSVNVRFLNDDVRGNLKIMTGSGDTVVSVPKNTKVITNLLSGSGSVVNPLSGSTLGAQLEIMARSGSGNVEMRTFER